MAKLDGIDPRSGRKTLGQAMQELIDANQVDASTQAAHAANHGPAGKDSQVAKGVLGRNTYPNSQNSLKSSADIVPSVDGKSHAPGSVDIAPAALKAVGEIARDMMQNLNDYVPNEIAAEATGGRRGDDITDASINGAETFLQKLGSVAQNEVAQPDSVIDAVSALRNFNLLSGGEGADGFPEISNGGMFTGAQLLSLLDKLGSGTDLKARSLLLATIAGHGKDDPNAKPVQAVPGAVHEVLEGSNRYSPSSQSPYIKNPSSPDENSFFADGLYSLQVGSGKLGVYNKDAKSVKTIDLSRMAMQLMVQAQSHNSLAEMIDEGFVKGEAGGGSFLFDLAALVPGVTQIGAARIEQRLMRIKSTHRAGEFGGDSIAGQDDFFPVQSGDVVLGAGPSSRTDGQADPRSAGSYGQMNSFVEPFDGPMPFGMFFITLYSLIALLVLSLIVGAISGTLSVGPKDAANIKGNAEEPGSLQLGFNSRGGGGDDLGSLFFKLFGLPNLDFGAGTCLIRGVERFYDVPSLSDLISGAAGFEEVLETAVGMALAPGYYATITKQILRDFEQVTESILALGQNASVFNVIAGIFKVVETLFSSFTFRFFVFLMNLGNIDLQSRKAFGVTSTGQLVAPVDDKQKGKNQKLPKTAFSRMRLSRFGQSSSPLGLSYFPGVMNVPIHSYRDTLKGGSFRSAKKGEIIDAKTLASDVTQSRVLFQGRITKDQLQAVEDALDVEYMPFYFHDLRTDEVFSMPAFVSAFSEDFAPEYNETHGYGRTDPVLTYSKTKRNMTIDFKLVSFSPKDHDYMWFVINKLVAMCYPQRSAGQKRFLPTGESFVQPFSQVPIASPMIRLRLGEVLKSNYSKTSLARLFGLLGAPGRSNIAGDVTSEEAQNFAHNLAVAELSLITGADVELELKEVPSLPMVILPGTTLSVFLDNGGKDKSKDVTIIDASDENDPQPVPGLLFKPEKIVPTRGKGVYLEGTVATKGLFDDVNDVKKRLAPLGAAGIKFLFPDDDLLVLADAGIPTLTVKARVLLPEIPSEVRGKVYEYQRAEVRKQAISELDIANPLSPADEKNVNFMKAANNPVVASFEAARGRGMAGFITALSLDYAESNWDTRPGNRAPQTVNVSMTFAPVHDLPLGLDADGSIIAPSHPVGSFQRTDPYNEMDDGFGNAVGNQEVRNKSVAGFNDAIATRNDVNVD